ncbi:hypothetical protein [Halobacillus campisalis]|uniref:DUF2975 domain-containing protein n=1 Tax=Halobacillus campisalis TaxID=435909 RepID=A0ABW2K6U1_9BACI|nr:hypothetical protein [Halobacillus campisalis]
MKLNAFYKIASIFCIILFYVVALAGLLSIAFHIGYLWFPDSAFTKSVGPFEPIYSYLTLHFNEQPRLYDDPSFIRLSFLNVVAAFLFVNLFLWLLYRFLKNIYKHGLFVEQNVSVILRLGLTFIILGTAYAYTDELMTAEAVARLEVTNATISFSSLYYIDTLLGGIIMIIIALALRTAVGAVEENKKTI